ncbi:DoxX family protein [Nocardia arthritidis]|uniref:DoxX family protein n=1 Tax=Nocardia arthritidis TaxID=228602 RepID=A0A6G9YD71_9NOCA|nr:DoxX family protein [Nocardia arthritidis]QIS11017.1 DoxX family protein [Nocardia arthritidis]
MNIWLWVLQSVLAAVFAAAGLYKLLAPRAALADNLGDWVNAVPAPVVKSLGLVEALGAIGLIAPAITGIAPILTPIAAVGVGVVMMGAIAVHARRGEYVQIEGNFVLAVMAVAVAWGRFGPYAF